MARGEGFRGLGFRGLGELAIGTCKSGKGLSPECRWVLCSMGPWLRSRALLPAHLSARVGLRREP